MKFSVRKCRLNIHATHTRGCYFLPCKRDRELPTLIAATVARLVRAGAAAIRLALRLALPGLEAADAISHSPQRRPENPLCSSVFLLVLAKRSVRGV